MRKRILSLTLVCAMLMTLFVPLCPTASAAGDEPSATMNVGNSIPGDINADGKVNLKDVVALYRYVVGESIEVVENALDVNGDEVIDVKDVFHLFNYTAGWPGIVLYREESKPTHSFVFVEGKAATCTESGLTDGKKCSVCNVIFIEQTVIPAKGHTAVIIPGKDATCAETGLTEGKKCSVCNKILIEQQTVNKSPHKYEYTYDLPSWEVGGKVSRSCEVCQETIVVNEISPYSETLYGYQCFAKDNNGQALQRLYRDMYFACEKIHLSDEDYPLNHKISFNLNAYSVSPEEAISVWVTFRSENPQFYWIDNAISWTNSSIEFVINEAYIKSDVRTQLETDILGMLTECSILLESKNTDFERVIAIYDYIFNKIEYAYIPGTQIPQSEIWAHNIIGASSKSSGVCECYAKTFLYLCELNNINCIVVMGRSVSESHMWNMVHIDGEWYNIDLTFDDGLQARYTYSSITSDLFMENHTTSSEYGINYCYEFPTPATRPIELVYLYEKDSYLGAFVNIDKAFERMNDTAGDYRIVLYNDANRSTEHQITSTKTPTSNSITILGNWEDSMYICSVGIQKDLLLYADLEISDISLTGTGSLQLQNRAFITSGRACQIHVPVIGDISDKGTSKIINNTSITYSAVYSKKIVVAYIDNSARMIIRDSAHILNMKSKLCDFMNTYGTQQVFIKNLYDFPDNHSTSLYLNYASNLHIDTVYTNNGGVNIQRNFGNLDEFSPLHIGKIEGNLRLSIDGTMSYIMTDQQGNVTHSWTERCSPLDLVCPIATIDDLSSGGTYSISFVSETGYWIDYNFLYELNEKGEIMLKEHTVENDIIVIDNIAMIYMGDADIVEIPEGVTEIAPLAFDRREMSTVIMPDTVKVIGNNAFQECKNLKNVYFSNNLEIIGSCAFVGCSLLENVILPDSLKIMEGQAFAYCTNLKSIIIPDKISYIPSLLFNNCTGLMEVIIPEGVSVIDQQAFCRCTALTSIVIPKSVTNINYGAFDNCTKITEVYYTGTKAEWAAINILRYNENLTNATIHYNHK